MKIVIDIEEKIFEELTKYNEPVPSGNRLYDSVLLSIYNGTPLPKGHGNLIDYDDLIVKLDRYGRKNVKYQLPYSPTIIEADKRCTYKETGCGSCKRQLVCPIETEGSKSE